ncbi:TonB-dependent receptor [Asticcacaulis sp. W401b]|uniref:TonB-dependent receptor n=1 Tax=Asticcacaulis sp. W401b TaxID=3388666 RepID=UPI0039707CB0
MQTFMRGRVLLVAGLLSGTALALVHTAAAAEDVEATTVIVTGERAGYNPKASVTATKTYTSLSNVPQAVTVIGEKQINDQAIQSMAEAVRYVPGFGATQGEGNRDGLVFRGNSSTADLFVDGMRDDVQYYRDTYNIERIEAFKGPNAMIFGRGSPGGLINRVTKVADFTETGRLNLQAGSYDKKRVTVDMGRNLAAEASFRVTGLWEDSGSYRDGVNYQRQGINPTLAFRAGDETLITLGYEFYKDERIADRGIPSYSVASGGTRHPVETDASTFFGNPSLSPTWSEVNAFQAFVEHRFKTGVTLRNRFRLANYDKFYQNVFPGNVNAAGTTVGISAYNNLTKRENVFNQTDLVFSARTGGIAHTLLAGVEIGRQETDNLRKTGYFTLPDGACLNGSTTTNCIVSLSAPTLSVPMTFTQSASDAKNTGVNTFTAVYVQDQIVFNDQWQAVAGIRFDRFEAEVTNLRATTPETRDLSSQDDLISPRLGLIYKPAENLSLYASYGVTYLPRSGEQLASLSVSNQALDPEEFHNYEIGAKWDVNPALSFTAAAYRLNRGNSAVTDPNDSTKLVLLPGDAQRMEGVELSLAGQVTSAWQVIAGYAWQDARTVQAVGSTPAGRILPQTPDNSFSLWNRYDFTPKLGAALGVLYRDKSYASISNDVTLDSYTRVDGALYYTLSQKLLLQLNVENLFDIDYYPNAHSDSNITPGAPRSAYVTLSVKY